MQTSFPNASTPPPRPSPGHPEKTDMLKLTSNADAAGAEKSVQIAVCNAQQPFVRAVIIPAMQESQTDRQDSWKALPEMLESAKVRFYTISQSCLITTFTVRPSVDAMRSEPGLNV
eukprot:TRINITY_DN9791_c0_g1_i1.p2 TRINITY_DN9791_c0_g1~~TRINITY_DN9791_c0_g1_i1.p2  ORF type:complete len:116 (-),score=6.88 TRINITY_DN9791_c0_g1_i1:1407-1754(-)